MKFLPAYILVAVLIASCATTAPLPHAKRPVAQYQVLFSDRSEFDYMYEKFYLRATDGSDMSSRQRDQVLCEQKSIDYVMAQSKGYNVIRSFGTSDEEQITEGTLSCLHKAGWKVFELRHGKIIPVGDQEIFNLFMGGRK